MVSGGYGMCNTGVFPHPGMGVDPTRSAVVLPVVRAETGDRLYTALSFQLVLLTDCFQDVLVRGSDKFHGSCHDRLRIERQRGRRLTNQPSSAHDISGNIPILCKLAPRRPTQVWHLPGNDHIHKKTDPLNRIWQQGPGAAKTITTEAIERYVLVNY